MPLIGPASYIRLAAAVPHRNPHQSSYSWLNVYLNSVITAPTSRLWRKIEDSSHPEALPAYLVWRYDTSDSAGGFLGSYPQHLRAAAVLVSVLRSKMTLSWGSVQCLQIAHAILHT